MGESVDQSPPQTASGRSDRRTVLLNVSKVAPRVSLAM